MPRKEREPQGYKPSQNDRIICQHNGVNYEAKVVSVGKDPKDPKGSETKYLVHYQGWNKNWDEWVAIDRIQEWTEDNIKALQEQGKKVKNSSKGPGSGRKRLALQQPQAETTVVESEEPLQIEKEIKIKIPEELKSWLIDDESNIRAKKLTNMPAKPTITTILKEFINHKKATSRIISEAVLVELTLGLKDYFNVMLGPHLLYKFERLQYQNLLDENGKDVDLTSHYGVIHLVRLFTKIGRVLAHSTLEPQNVQTIVGYLQDLLKFLAKQADMFDLENNYIMAPPDYIKNALK